MVHPRGQLAVHPALLRANKRNFEARRRDLLSCSNIGRESDGRRRLDAVFTGNIRKTSKVSIRSLAMFKRLEAVKDLFINNTFEVAL